MTTVPATATTTELGYLAEAIADHYRRNPAPAGAALDLAVVLASVLPPVQLNEITDALDAHALIADAAVELEAAIAGERYDVAHVDGGRWSFTVGPRGHHADVVIVDEAPDGDR